MTSRPLLTRPLLDIDVTGLIQHTKTNGQWPPKYVHITIDNIAMHRPCSSIGQLWIAVWGCIKLARVPRWAIVTWIRVANRRTVCFNLRILPPGSHRVRCMD